MAKTPIEVTGATVPFTTYEDNGLTYYEFNTSGEQPPAPMVNAMSGLQLLTDDKKRLVMINMQKPNGLLPKIEDDFDYDFKELDDGNVQLVFRLKGVAASNTDFTSTECNG